MNNGLIFAILGLTIGALVTKAIENKNNPKLFVYLVLILAVAAVIIAFRIYLNKTT